MPVPAENPTSQQIRELFERWGAAQPLGDIRDALLAQYALDSSAHAALFEPSISLRQSAAEWMRFSYGFAGFKDQPTEVRATLGRWCRLFGVVLPQDVPGVAELIAPSIVDQPLWGLAYGGKERWRMKMYLRLAERRADDAATAVIDALGDFAWSRSVFAGPVHTVGLDWTPRGLMGAKFYCRIAPIEWPGLAARWPEVCDALARFSAGPTRPLQDVLAVYHVDLYSTAKAPALRSVDVGISPAQWLELEPEVRRLALAAQVPSWMAEIPIQGTRLSLHASGTATLYYQLRRGALAGRAGA